VMATGHHIQHFHTKCFEKALYPRLQALVLAFSAFYAFDF